MLCCSALGSFGGKGRFHHEPHLREFLKRGVVEEKEKLHGHSQNRGGVLVEIAAIADFLGNHTHDLKNLQRRPQRGTSNTEVCGEFAFRWEFSSRREQPFTQQLLEA